MYPDIIHDNHDVSAFLSTMRSSSFVALFGSKISDWEPSELPPGELLTATIAKLLSEGVTNPSAVEAAVKRAAFEHVMEGCPNLDVLGNNLLSMFSRVNPNPLHLAIAKLVEEGQLEHIVTTNYDANLEEACRITCSSQRQPQVIVTEQQANNAQIGRPVIFKIHGCVTHDQNRAVSDSPSMIYTLAREGELPNWKRQLLHRLVSQKQFLVCGYSGRDFEICPELVGLQANIVWNCFSNPNLSAGSLSPNARRVLMATNGKVIVGDMRSVLGTLANTPAALGANNSRTTVDLKDQLTRNLSRSDLELWRLRTLVSIGAAREAVKYATSLLNAPGLDAATRFQLLMNLARAHFHAGAYGRSARAYRQAEDVAKREGQSDWAFAAKSDLIEAYRCRGSWIKAHRELKNLEKLIPANDEQRRAVVALRSVLLSRNYYQLGSAIKVVPWLVRRVRAHCKAKLTVVVENAKQGRWHDLQQAELWASRLGIAFSDIYRGPLTPLPSKEGYEQLGYIIAESMSLRDQVAARASNATESVLQKMMTDVESAGANAELWKLVWVVMRKRGVKAVPPVWRRAAFRAWWNTEYNLPMRLFVLLFH